jgi:hypothetical protein
MSTNDPYDLVRNATDKLMTTWQVHLTAKMVSLVSTGDITEDLEKKVWQMIQSRDKEMLSLAETILFGLENEKYAHTNR